MWNDSYSPHKRNKPEIFCQHFQLSRLLSQRNENKNISGFSLQHFIGKYTVTKFSFVNVIFSSWPLLFMNCELVEIAIMLPFTGPVWNKMWLKNIFIFSPLFHFGKEKASTFAKRYIVLPTLQFPDKNVKRLLLPPTKGKRRAIYCSSENFSENKCILVVACVCGLTSLLKTFFLQNSKFYDAIAFLCWRLPLSLR